MDAFHREVAEPRGPEGAPIADAVPKDPPGEDGSALVVPGGPDHLAVVVGLREAEAKGDCADAPDPFPSRLRDHVSRKPEAAYLSSFGGACFRSTESSLGVDTALVLAGGESKRFGRPKALLDVGGTPMVRRVVDAIGPLAGELVVSVATSEMVSALRPILPEAAFSIDGRSERGPIEGFRRGFDVAQGDRVLVAPCDAPLLQPGLYRLFLRSLGRHECVVSKFDVFDPLRAIYRRRVATRILRSDESIASPSALVDRLRCCFVDADRIRAVDPDLASYLDVNTQADLDEVLARLERQSGGRAS